MVMVISEKIGRQFSCREPSKISFAVLHFVWQCDKDSKNKRVDPFDDDESQPDQIKPNIFNDLSYLHDDSSIGFNKP